MAALEGHDDLQSYITSVEDTFQPWTQNSAVLTPEIRAKIEETKKKIAEIIKNVQNPPEPVVRIVGIIPQSDYRYEKRARKPIQSASVSSSSDAKPIEKDPTGIPYSDDDSDDSDDLDENSPLEKGSRIVGVGASNGTASPVPSTSRGGPSGQELPDGLVHPKPDKNGRTKYYWDDDHPEDYYIEHAESLERKEKEKNQNLRSLYRLLFWLDLISSGYNRDEQHLRHF